MAEYFSHDYNARNDVKLKRVFMRHGVAGLGIYWCIVEMLYESGGALPIGAEDVISYDLRTDVETVKSILCDFGLFVFDDETFTSTGVKKRLDLRSEQTEKRKQAAKARWEKLSKQEQTQESTEQLNANAMQVHSKCIASALQNDIGAEQINANKTKLNKMKLNEIKGNKRNNLNTICTEQSELAPVPQLPLNDGTLYAITKTQYEQWVDLYPAVNVEQEIRNMCGWLTANKQRRKTKGGIERFIVNWLSKTQNSGSGSVMQTNKHNLQTQNLETDTERVRRELNEWMEEMQNGTNENNS